MNYLKNKKGSVWALLYVFVGMLSLIILYLSITPAINSSVDMGRNILNESTIALSFFDFFEVAWGKILPILFVVILLVYAVVSALRIEPTRTYRR